ncbi:MAG: hypothetical protein AMJ79_09405 [Phycisphaerae bacterium SM23_30]|nr:MAG: hypothetical protein AMJ79_09405 [Phycisphaerae bacterium SM23_30]
MDESIFKAYDIRGMYEEHLNEEDAWKIGHATAQFLRSLLSGFERGQSNYQSLIVGRDMRTHSWSLAQALIKGMNGSGANVVDIGMIDTPQIYFAINHLQTCGGVQVTASHNPARYNGFKISGMQARPIGSQTGLLEIKHIALALRHTAALGKGKVTERDLTEPYRRHVLSFLGSNLKRLKVAIDASNGMAGKWVPIIFGDLDMEIIPLNFECTGSFKHDPNPLVEANLAELKEAVVQKKADLGLCFDGDGDRLMIVDERAQTVGCDIMTALMAGYFLEKHPGATILYDLRSSRVVEQEIKRRGGQPRRERVGHAFMKKTLKDTKGVFGGELSGHFYYRDNFYADSGMITLAHVLNVLSVRDKPLSELVKPLMQYASTGEVNFEVEDKEAMMEQLAQKYADGAIDYLDGVTVQYDDWWFNCRPSDKKFDELKAILGKPVDH